MRSIPYDPDAEVTLAVVQPCDHAPPEATVHPDTAGCGECVSAGREDWVHLRLCLTCGHVGCCDSSPGRHATAHHASAGHPVMTSVEQGDAWAWCYEDETMMRTRPLDTPRA
jgi:monovalent cation:H+ antiporter-2, CPA2 family